VIHQQIITSLILISTSLKLPLNRSINTSSQVSCGLCLYYRLQLASSQSTLLQCLS